MAERVILPLGHLSAGVGKVDAVDCTPESNRISSEMSGESSPGGSMAEQVSLLTEPGDRLTVGAKVSFKQVRNLTPMPQYLLEQRH